MKRKPCECPACEFGDASDPCQAIPTGAGADDREPRILSAEEADAAADLYFGELESMRDRHRQ